MKKKNWLMTIAFAVLALTIVSTCVIGSTYAKFTSTVSNAGTVQAAGFLVTGSTTGTTGNVLLAPGGSQNVKVDILYFSQVATDITVANSNDTAHNTGAFSDANWAALRTYYVANAATLKTWYGITETPANSVSASTTVADLIAVDTDASAAALCAAIYAEEESNGDTAKFSEAYTTGTRLPAMLNDVTAAASGSINVAVSWADGKYGDTFDTFVGNVIAKLAQASVAGDLTGWKPDGTHEITLTFTEANEVSRVSTSVSVTATQYIAPVNP